MATVSKQNRQPTPQHVQKQPSGRSSSLASSSQPATVHGRRGWKLAIAAGAVVVLVWLLPGIVAHTPILTWAIRSGTADLQGTVHVQSASLGWFSPVAASGIAVRDGNSRPVLAAGSVSSEKSLLSLLCNLSSPGKFRVEKPQLNVQVRSDGSNVEELLAKYLTSQEPSQGRDFSLEVVDGRATITDEVTRQTWQVENLQLTLGMSRDATGPTRLETSAEVTGGGRLAVKLNMLPGGTAASTAADSGEVSLQAEALPLAMFQRLAARFLPGTRLDGRLSATLTAQWGGSGTGIQADVTTEGFSLAAEALGKDELRLDALHAACRGSLQGRRLEIQDSVVECEVAKLNVAGKFDLDAKTWSNFSDALLRQTYDVRGGVDLARLAKLLPGTLRIRQGTEITSGQVAMVVSSRSAGGTPALQAWQAQLDVGSLTAVDRGRQVVWDKPIRCELAAHETPQGPVIDHLRCISEFLSAQASGTPDKLAASLSLNLQQLSDQLGRFVDLGGVKLAGDGWANVNWTRQGTGQGQELVGECQVRKFQLAMPGRQPWVEEELAATLSVRGGTNLWTDRRVDAAELHVRAGADQLDAKLLQPVTDPSGAWPLDVAVQGQLERWPARLRTFVALDTWRLGGPFQLAARVNAGPDAMSVEKASLRAGPVVVAGPSLNIQEPSIELAASGSWDFGKRTCRLPSLTLTSSAVSARATDLAIAMPSESPWQMTGTVDYRGDLDRLRLWFADAAKPPTWRMTGQLSGTAQLQPAAGQIQARAEAEIVNLAMLSSGQKYQEPHVRLTAVGNYEPQSGVLKLDQCELSSASLSAKAAGQTAQRQNQREVQFNGEVTYDWEKLCGLAQPWIGSWIRVAGRGNAPLSYRGPLSLETGEGFASARWDRANIVGFPLGAGELKARLADGMLQAEPIRVSCSQGQINLTPALRLSPGAMELTVAKGATVQRVQITPGMCAAALKYAAPVLADVAVVQGTFSIELDGCRLPLSDPAKGELAGRFIIHAVDVGPGPMIRELAVLLNRAGIAKLKRESVVPFRMVQGRVYHQNLELEFPDLTIRTSGSVGVDQTLAVQCEMPVPPKWIGNNPLGNALRNKVVRLPLAGTLSQPRLDQKEIARANRELFGNAAVNVLESEVGKQLDRLLGPPR